MTPEQLQKKISDQLKDAQVQVVDLTGTADHYQVTVVSPSFEGMSMIQQHRMVKSIFDRDIASGEVHALSLKTFTPQEWAQKGGQL